MSPVVQMWATPVSLPRPIRTPAGTFETYHHLVVVLDGGDTQGWGLAATVTAEDLELTIERARALLLATADLPDGMLAVEEVESSGVAGQPGRRSRWAASAISSAAWDLHARRLGVRCADLWSLGAVPGELDSYASGLFLGSSIDELARESENYRAAGYTMVKMRTGGAVDSDLQRLAVVRRSFPERGAIAVDSVNGWTPDAALSFAERAGSLLWVEDPVPLDVIDRMTGAPQLIAAGESLTSLADLSALFDGGAVPAMLLDVQQLGGPGRFLEAARQLGASGARIGSHIFTHVSVQLLASIEEPLPVEVFDWSDPLLVQPIHPEPSGRIRVRGPGMGVDLDHDLLVRNGTRVV